MCVAEEVRVIAEDLLVRSERCFDIVCISYATSLSSTEGDRSIALEFLAESRDVTWVLLVLGP